MNLSLYQLKKKLKLNKQAQGSLIAIVLGGVVLSTIVASGTSWYLTMRNNLGDTEDKLEAQTIAMSEWERLSHMSLDELEANRNTFKTPYSAGTGSQFSISVNLGEKGTFNGGTCGNVTGGYANCFKNTTITVYRDGNRMFTTRTLPLMAGDYTRKEIDAKLATLDTKINNNTNKINNNSTAITNLTNRLNGKEFVKNKTSQYDMNFRYEQKTGEDKASIHAYIGNTEVPIYSQNDGKVRQLSSIHSFLGRWTINNVIPYKPLIIAHANMNRTDGGGACTFYFRSGIVPSTLSLYELGFRAGTTTIVIPNSTEVVIETTGDMPDDGDTLIAYQ